MQEIHQHEKWKKDKKYANAIYYDVAIIQVHETFDFEDSSNPIYPICLPEQPKNSHKKLSDKDVNVQGYGLGKLYKGIYDCSNGIT